MSHLAVALPGEVVDDGCRGDRFAGTRRSLDQAQRLDQRAPHSGHLEPRTSFATTQSMNSSDCKGQAIP